MTTLLTPQEAADMLRVAPRTLETWRRRQVGPEFVRVGHLVRYRPEDLGAWLAEVNAMPMRHVEAQA